MRRILAFTLVALSVVLQVSLLPAFRPLGVVPNLALVMVVLVALKLATSEALIAATAAGLALDVAGGANFGLWTGTLMLATLVIGMVHRAGIELDRAFVAPVLVMAGTVVLTSVIWLGLLTGGQHLAPGFVLKLVVELVINLTLTVVLSPVVRVVSGGVRTGMGE